MSVMADGNVVPCTQISNHEIVLGNVKENTLEEIWNGKKYDRMVNAHKDGKRDMYVPCDRCPIGASNGN